MLAALIGAALALPPAHLGPDGPAWIGPLPPRQHARELRGAPWTDAVVVVSPLDGSLWVQAQDLPGVTRVWSGGEWTVDGARLTEEWPPTNAVSYRLVDERLWSVTSVGGSERFRYDRDGRLTSISWADGSRMEVAYDAIGRVSEVQGPGLSRWRLRWGQSLRVQNTLGHLTTFFWRSGPEGPILEVQDPLGRSARTFYSDDAEPQLLGWEDPRGLQTRLEQRDDVLTISDGSGRRWRVEIDSRRRPDAVELPGGRRWRWTRDGGGLLIAMQDPSGRTVRWERDKRGHITAISRGGTPVRFSRDPSGQITAITDPTGAVTALTRDGTGRISEITDATGNALGIERYANGMPMAILSRTGGRWGLGLDLQGRPDRLIDPTDRVIEFHRDGLGWLSRLVDERFGQLQLNRRSDGVLTRLIGFAGEKTGLIRDAAGRVARIQLPDGETIVLARDILGEIIRVSLAEEAVSIRRDTRGLPVQVDDITWEREPDGSVRSITTPSLSLSIQRDAAGRLQALESGKWWLRIERDLAGNPNHWEGADGVVVAIRDAAGRISVEEGAQKITVLRDPRGLRNRLSIGEQSWQWMRDAAGRPMRLIGPDGLALGIDRDNAGRVSLLRLPDGTILKRRWAGAGVLEQLFTSAGKMLLEQLTDFDAEARIRMRRGAGIPDEHWRYAPNGDLIAIERGEAVWVWGADRILGAEGELLLLDSEGRVVEARLAEGTPAWGVGRTLLSEFWDEAGRLSEVSGEGGVVFPEYDTLGRLTGIRTLDGEHWELVYDARGRLQHITAPDGSIRQLQWAPEAFGWWWQGQSEAPLSDGVPLLSLTDATVSAQAAWLDLLAGERWWVGSDDRGEAQHLAIPRTPMGLPNAAQDALISPDGGIQVFPGGPIIHGTTAIDPVSGARLDGLSALPWMPRTARQAPQNAALDPARWAPQNQWGEPLAILTALGELAPVSGGHWMSGNPSLPTIYWLPPALEGGAPPLGPLPTDLPLSEDPITEALLRALLPGGLAPTPGVVLEAIRAEEREELDIPPEIPLSWLSKQR